MKIWEKLFYSGMLVLLVIFFFFSNIYSINDESEGRVYNITVITNGSSDSRLKNLKKGLDYGVTEFHVDMNFITLYEDDDVDHQQELIHREIENGVDGIILIPSSGEGVYELVGSLESRIPFIFLMDGDDGDGITAVVAPDNRNLGRMAAEQIMAGSNQEQTVYIVTDGRERRSIQKRYDGLTESLRQAGREFISLIDDDNEDVAKTLKYLSSDGNGLLVAALDEESLIKVAGILEQEDLKTGVLYGIGSNNQIIRYIEMGMIEGTVATDDFAIGYLAMEQCIRAINNDGVRRNIVVKSVFTDADTIYGNDNEKILFPIS